LQFDREEPEPVTLMVHRGLYIRGRVVRSDGSDYEPRIPQTSLILAKSPTFYANTTADAEGRFIIGPLPRGEYRLTASGGADFADSEPTDARAGSDDVVLKLRDGLDLLI